MPSYIRGDDNFDSQVIFAGGTSGQVLTSNGSGSAPSWQAGGGTAMLVNASFSNVASYNFTATNSTLYSGYIIRFHSVYPATAGDVGIRISTDGGSSYISSGYDYMLWGEYETGATMQIASSSHDMMPVSYVTHNAAAYGGTSATVYLYSPDSATHTNIHHHSVTAPGTSNKLGVFGMGSYPSATAVNAFQIVGTGNIYGRISVEGILK
jgi:hypothetical protein